MPQAARQPLAFAQLAAAEDALAHEVDPYALLTAASPICESAPNLSWRLQAKAKQAFRIRLMLRRAAAGELAAGA